MRDCRERIVDCACGRHQRVTRRSVTVDGRDRRRCRPRASRPRRRRRGDGPAEADALAGKVARLRIFENDDGQFDRSIVDVGGEALVVSQFTLIADATQKGIARLLGCCAPEVAEPLYERFCDALPELGVPVETGVFGARMQRRTRQRRPGDDHPRLERRGHGRLLPVAARCYPLRTAFQGLTKWAQERPFLLRRHSFGATRSTRWPT